MGMINFTWTPETSQLLSDMWLAYSATDICKAIKDKFEGTEKISRCAVLGRAKRLGLPLKRPIMRGRRDKIRLAPPPAKPRKRVLLPRIGAIPPKSRALAKPKIIVRLPPPIELPPVQPYVPGELIDLMHLVRSSCRYPMKDAAGDDPTMFCGQEVFTDGKSYCAHHYRLCYQPRDAKKKMVKPFFSAPAKSSRRILEEV